MDDHSSWPKVAPAPLAANPNPIDQRCPVVISKKRSTHLRFLFGIAPGGACHARPVTRPPVGSYPTLSPLPATSVGGLLSVALSVGLPRPGVTRHHFFVESGLSSTQSGRDHPVPAHSCSRREKRQGQLQSAFKAASSAKSKWLKGPLRWGAKCCRSDDNSCSKPRLGSYP